MRIGAKITKSGAGLWVGTLSRPWGAPRVYGLYHPAARSPYTWDVSQASLIELLNRTS
jgi:hypothetical protein